MFNIGDIQLEENAQQSSEDIQTDDEITSLGLTECKPVPNPVEFAVNDPLGRRAINNNASYLTGSLSVDRCSSKRARKSLGEQASVIISPHDRVVALQRTTVAAQILLSRELVLKVLSVLCKGLAPEAITRGLEIMGLADVKLLVNLMRLVASGRAHVDKPIESSKEVVMSNRSATLRVLGRAVSSLISSQPSSARLLLQVCENDLMASATG